MVVSTDRSSYRPVPVYAITGFATVLCIVSLQLTSLMKTHDGIPERMLRIPSFSLNQSVGFDGQYYLALARDPLLLHGSTDVLDAPVLRARRIGLPMVSRVLGLSGLSHAAALIAAESLFIVLLTGCITFAAAAARLPFLIIPAGALALPFVLSIELVTSELPASMMLLFALGALWMSKPGAASLFLGMACLFKEVAVLAVVACVVAIARDRDAKSVAIVLGSLIPFGLWNVYLLWILPDQSVWTGMSGNLCPIPGSGLLTGIIRSAELLLNQVNTVKSAALLSVCMWILVGIILSIRLAVTGWSSARLSAAIGAVLTLFLCYGGQSQQYNEIFNFGRQLFLLPVGLLAVALMEGNVLHRSDRNILFSWLFLGGFLGLTWWIHHLGVRGCW